MSVIRSDLDEHFTEATFLLAPKHVEECLGGGLETVVLDLLELEITECKLFRDGVVEVFGVLVLKMKTQSAPRLWRNDGEDIPRSR